MLKALALVLTLTAVQEDPQVTYREGLFEEVDQGNLDKAAELYAKVLKSNAPDSIKAKALLRTGFCHEKKGQRKEAEQAWRDVIERYPGVTETTKIARDRLARPEGGAASPSQEEQIKALVLELGARSGGAQEAARRTLLLLGDPSVPHLRRALQHPDRMLSNNAAVTLIEMRLPEGVYDSIRRFWPLTGEATHDDVTVLNELTKNEDIERRFLKDVESLKKTPRMHIIDDLLCSLKDPAFSKIVEEWIAAPMGDLELVPETWAQNRSPADVLRLMKRLGEKGTDETHLILRLFYEFAKSGAAPDKDLKAEVLNAMAKGSHGYFSHFEKLAAWFSAETLVRGPLVAWYGRANAEERGGILFNIRHQIGSYPEFSREARKFLFEQLESPRVPLADKERIIESGYQPDSPEEMKKYLEFCLQTWKERRGELKLPPEERKRLKSSLWGVLGALAENLPLDSKDLPAVLDDYSDVGYFNFHLWTGNRRTLFFEAVLRCLARSPAHHDRIVEVFRQFGSVEERLRLGSALPGLGTGNAAIVAATSYAMSVMALDESRRPAELKELRARQASLPVSVQAAVLQTLAERGLPELDDLMREASKSGEATLRHAALRHWGKRDADERIGFLIAALNEPSASSQTVAIYWLQTRPSLDAVPELIRLLNSPIQEIRIAAEAALAAIKKHFEAQAEWKRWYDETKKSLGK